MTASRSLCLFVLLALAPLARADFQLVTDATAFGANDGYLYPTLLGSFEAIDQNLVSFAGAHVHLQYVGHSQPTRYSTFQSSVNGLFIGTGIEGNPGYGPGTAFFDLTLTFSSDNPSVMGFGAYVRLATIGPGDTQFIVTDINGAKQVFDLGSGDYRGYLGVLSDVPLASFEVFSSHSTPNDIDPAESALELDGDHLNVAPAPPGIVLAGLGTVCLLLVRLRSYKRG